MTAEWNVIQTGNDDGLCVNFYRLEIDGHFNFMIRDKISRNVTQSITQDLGLGIVTGRFDGINFPSEKDLASSYGAARSVTREAVKMLTSKGLIKSRPKAGIQIESEDRWNLLDPDVLRWLLERSFSQQVLRQFTEFRLGVEPNAAALAAQNINAAKSLAIENAIARMYAAEDDDEILSSDIAFHTAVLEASGNNFYLQMRQFIVTALTYSIRFTNELAGEHKASAPDHAIIANAIIAGKPKLAEAAMHDLIERALILFNSPEHAD